MRKILLACLLSLASIVGNAQLIEGFDDGDFTNNPTWIGDPANWVVNAANELQSNNTTLSSPFYLSTADTFAVGAEWGVNVRLAFSTSGSNYVDVYLIASASDLLDANTTGYFVRIGGTDDEISLYRKDAGGGVFKIIDGVDASVNSSTNNSVRLRVVRNANNVWSLFRQINTGATVLEGTSADATYTTSSYFGFVVKQSTATFFQKHFFDNIEVKDFVPDVTPPVLQSVTLISGTAIDVLFNEPIDAASAQTVANYFVDNGVGNPVSAVIDATNPNLVHLTFGATFPPGSTNTVTINNVTDLSGNAIANGTGTFSYNPDLTPPAIVSVSATSINTVDILFSETLDATTAEQVANYTADNGLGNPASATIDPTNRALVHLVFGTTFGNAILYTLTVNNVSDVSGNPINNGTGTFSFYIAQYYDVVIDEIMADPDPAQGLPAFEYIELRNTSNRPINLEGWRLSGSSTTSGAFGSFVLQPDSFVIVTGTTAAVNFNPYGSVLAITSFPALSNGGATLQLKSKEGLLIHTVSYSDTWYQNLLKKEGGWSLEMIDTRNPCNGANNWRASTDPRGGTPGMKNSIDAINPDLIAPALIRAAVTDSVTIIVTFSEAADSAQAALISNYTITPTINTPISAVAIAPDFTRVQLTLGTPMQRGTTYLLEVSNVSDCSGNAIGAGSSAKIGIPEQLDSFDVVINEILFDPKSAGVDFVEIYNRSNKIVDLKNLYINNRSTTTNQPGTPIAITTENLLMFPGDFYVLTSSPETIKQGYTALNPDNFITVSLPSFADDKGTVILMNSEGVFVDELTYSDKWHFALLDNKEAISLERIDYDRPTQDQENWASAASTAGFGTPTYKNSQARAQTAVAGEINIVPKIFSPDNDGYDDFSVINYQIADPGYVATITIFDAAGRPVKVIARNATLAQKGSFRWDGLNDKMAKVPVGVYVVFTEMFNLQGKKRSFKNTVVVASRF